MSSIEEDPVKKDDMSIVKDQSQFSDITGKATSPESEDGAPKKKRVWWKIVLKYMFSTVGLFFLVMLYSVVGGLIFQALETPEEEAHNAELIRVSDDLIRLQQALVKNLYLNLTQDNVTEEEFKNQAYEYINDWRLSIVNASVTLKYNSSMIGVETKQIWTLASAIMFATTIVTTVGYGNITPKSMVGRLVTIGYALFGLPLMMMFLANIGDVLANGIKYIYNRLCCYTCNQKYMMYEGLVVQPQAMYNQPEMEEANVGNITPVESQKEPISDLTTARGHFRGYPLIVENDDGRIAQQGDAAPEGQDQTGQDQVAQKNKVENRIPDRPVPWFITLLLLAGYIALGGICFSVWEGWSPTIGAYFSFVTISTIGFGDFVPGTKSTEEENYELVLIIVAAYMLLGMSVLSMVVTLLLESLKTTAKKVAAKVQHKKLRQKEQSLHANAIQSDQPINQVSPTGKWPEGSRVSPEGRQSPEEDPLSRSGAPLITNSPELDKKSAERGRQKKDKEEYDEISDIEKKDDGNEKGKTKRSDDKDGNEAEENKGEDNPAFDNDEDENNHSLSNLKEAKERKNMDMLAI